MSAPTWRVPLSDVVVDDALSAAGREVLESGWWSMGPRVAQLESQFQAFADVQHALAVANGTAALHLALLALECGPGDEVVLPSLNFVAAANTVVWTGATPVFCDVVGPDDLNLDPDDLEHAITPSTKAVIALHYGGYPCDLARVLEITEQRDIAVIEDAAHAIGAQWNGRAAGTIGAIGCFSFFANKNLPVGEGGMVVTDDDELAERIRLLRSHGMTTLTWQRHSGHASSYDVVTPGLNYRLDELRSASPRFSSADFQRRTPPDSNTCAGTENCWTASPESRSLPRVGDCELVAPSRGRRAAHRVRRESNTVPPPGGANPDERPLSPDSSIHGVLRSVVPPAASADRRGRGSDPHPAPVPPHG